MLQYRNFFSMIFDETEKNKSFPCGYQAKSFFFFWNTNFQVGGSQ